MKYLDGISKRIGLHLASQRRKAFSGAIRKGKLPLFGSPESIDFEIISFSGSRDFEEQMLSILTFIHHAGMPRIWTLYSDGSHKADEKSFLNQHFPFVRFKLWNENQKIERYPLLEKYLDSCHLAKKLHAILTHPIEGQTIYTDSDVVFYPNISLYFSSPLLQSGLWYMSDTNWDSFRKQNAGELKKMYHLNSGFMVLNKTFDFNLNLEYFENLNLQFTYFSEQNSFDYSFGKQKTSLLDPRQFIVSTDDQFNLNTTYLPEKIALRHYINPVRHKMWQYGWKWHLKK